MAHFERTVGCGQVTSEHLQQTITLSGWVNRRRDHGKLMFIDLRDRSGLMQTVLSPELNQAAYDVAQTVRAEYVLSVTGKVVARAAGTTNAELATGSYELQVEKLIIHNTAHNLPFALDEGDSVDEELRLKYRYLDLRRPVMLERLKVRHEMLFALREFLHEKKFYEIETPILTRNTAEGAREFLVPSRIHKGSWYALPQSPQLYKQLLMAGGLERYFQIARCFRDEDLRADRQPEFTQLDLEMSFINEADIQALIEQLVAFIVKKIFNIVVPLPLLRMKYDDAFAQYGCDKPDMRFEMLIKDITPLFAATELSFIRQVLQQGGKVGALRLAARSLSRSELEQWVETARQNGAKGLVWIKFAQDGTVESPVAKFLPADFLAQVQQVWPEVQIGDTLMLIASSYTDAWTQLGRLRLQLAEKYQLIPANVYKFLWVTDFPLLAQDEAGNWSSVHHPFTSPQPGWETQQPGEMRARAYDIVLNGIELGGGSIRIHKPELQQKVFDFLGLDEAAMQRNFGFLLEAQGLGFPPHGGIALGLDRFVMIMLGCSSIRDVIAFPKTQRGHDLMMQAPTPVEPQKLAEYAIRTVVPNK